MKAAETEYWQRKKLGDFFRLKHGYAFKGEFFAEEGDYILLTPGNFKADGGVKLDKTKFYIGDIPDDFLLRREDLLIVMTDLKQDAPILGAPAFIPDDGIFLHNQRLGKVIDLDEKLINQNFLYYLLNSSCVRAQIKASATGATVRHTAPERIYTVEAAVPTLPTQRTIASILSAYDDLIENNQRRIKILEEMAQALYREWFVKFRFPGHEKVRMVDSPLGKIPEGWEVVPLSSVTDLISRGIAPKYENSSSNIVINQKCIRHGRLDLGPSRRHIKKVPTKKFVRFGDVLINSTGVGTLGRVGQVLLKIENCTVDTHVTIVRPLPKNNGHFFGLQLLELEKHFSNQGRGATGQTELGRDVIGETKYLNAPLELQHIFGEMAEPMRMLGLRLIDKNSTLRETRDLLLPKLISGELDVSEMDIDNRALE